MVRPIGVILAGGTSSRMGSDKALFEVAGRPMLDCVGAALFTVSERIIVAGRPDGWMGYECVPDSQVDRRGPLAGLQAAALRFPTERLVVVGVDQPWVRGETLRRMVEFESNRPVMPLEDGVRQPLCGVYPAGLASIITEELEGGGSIQSLLDRTSFDPVPPEMWQSWGEDGRSWFSVDTEARATEGLTRFGKP